MRILIVNSGSATLKIDLYRTDADRLSKDLSVRIERIGSDPRMTLTSAELRRSDEPVRAADPAQAAETAFSLVAGGFPGRSPAEYLDAVGFRMVHGADRYVKPTLLTDTVIKDLSGISVLAPLHNPPALAVIGVLREHIGGSVPFVGVFDTMFHATIPDAVALYAVPPDFPSKYKVRRYGFHGLAHEYMLHRYAHISGKADEACTIVTVQLGSGVSVTAVKNGRSIDTSMGFTPLEGPMMRTRAGDLDPGILIAALDSGGVSAGDLSDLLNRRSGLAGLTGTDGDMRTILAMSREDARARTAVESFTYRIRKYIGAYMAALNGAEAVVFGGGIGERSPEIRSAILSQLSGIGILLDGQANGSADNTESRISRDDSPVKAYVIPVDESERIAAHVRDFIPTVSDGNA